MLFGLDILDLVIRLPVVLFALTLHEFMHGYVAFRCGDDTAARAGRLTFNPIAHLDPIGTICLLFGPIGWAKPVPVDRRNLDDQTARRDDILISGAGIAANFVVAAGLALLARGLVMAGLVPTGEVAVALWQMMGMAILVNFGLGLFNLLPIFPLDGSHILRNLLPRNAAMRYNALSRFGPILLMGVVVLNLMTGFLSLAVIFVVLFATGIDAGVYLYPQWLG